MSSDSNLPMDLYKANVQLWMNMGLLLEESRQQWAVLRDRTLDDDVAETRKELEELAEVHDWKDLANLPGSTAWRQMQTRVGEAQACTQTVIAEQTRVVAGIQHALADWQKAVVQAFNSVGNSLPSALPGAADFGSLMAMFTPGSAAPSGKPAAKAKGHAH